MSSDRRGGQCSFGQGISAVAHTPSAAATGSAVTRTPAIRPSRPIPAALTSSTPKPSSTSFLWARRRRPVAGEELATTPLILRELGSGTRDVLDRALDPSGGPSTPALELGSNTAILGAVRRDEGPAVLSSLAVADDVAAGRVVQVPTIGVDLSRKVQAVWPRGHALSEPAQRLLRVARLATRKAS